MFSANLTSDEKMFAALSHGSVIFSFFGPIGPVIVWLLQREKSKYAAFHSLQAMGYQVISFWLWIIMAFIFPIILVVFILLGSFAFEGNENYEIFPIFIQAIMFFFIFAIWGTYILIGFVGAGFCIAGKDFRYPLLGTWLREYLGDDGELKEQFNQIKEETWIAAMCHATAIIFMWGVATPVIIWFSQKKRSVRLAFQSLQAAIYQTISIIIYFLGMAFYMLLFFGMMMALIAGGAMSPENSAELPSGIGIIFIMVFALFGIFWLVLMIATPVYYFLAAFASVRTVRGKDFNYPIIGQIIRRKMNYSLDYESTNANE